jgi:hypothetical protein
MKKIALAFGIIAMMVLGASCNKQKTCVCSYTATVLGITSTVELGEKVIESGSCSDLENAGAWNLQAGNLVDAKFHCEKK